MSTLPIRAIVTVLILVPLKSKAFVDNGCPIEISDTADEIGSDGFRERLDGLQCRSLVC